MISTAVQVRPYGEPDSGAWEQYVQAHPSATVFHRGAWSQAVEQAYGHHAMHLTAPGLANSWSDCCRALQSSHGEDWVYLVVKSHGRPVASVISFVFRDEIGPACNSGFCAHGSVSMNNRVAAYL